MTYTDPSSSGGMSTAFRAPQGLGSRHVRREYACFSGKMWEESEMGLGSMRWASFGNAENVAGYEHVRRCTNKART